MAITYRHYENHVEHVWYESSNVLYSQCFDNPDREKPLSVTFKNGATYLYSGVLMEDYLHFRNADSQGKALAAIKAKYPCKRLADASLEELEELRTKFEETVKEIQEKAGDLSYRLAIDDVSGKFRLYYSDRLLYEGVEGNVFIGRLLPSLGINFIVSPLEEDAQQEQNKTNAES